MDGCDFAELRLSLGLTQAALAAHMGVVRVTVARWETGVSPVPEDAAEALRTIVSSGEMPAKLGKPHRARATPPDPLAFLRPDLAEFVRDQAHSEGVDFAAWLNGRLEKSRDKVVTAKATPFVARPGASVARQVLASAERRVSVASAAMDAAGAVMGNIKGAYQKGQRRGDAGPAGRKR